MESRDGRALLRTMSFISSRARALRQRFGTSQPSLSDTWTAPSDPDTGPDAYLGEDPRLASPDMGGSLLSLLDAPEAGSSWPAHSASPLGAASGLADLVGDGRGGAGGGLFRQQRSKSLDSLSALAPGLPSPPGVCPMPLSPLLTRPALSPPPHAHIPRPHPAVSPVSLGRFPDSSIPRIPGPPPSPLKFSTISAPTTPRHVDSYSPLTPRFADSIFVPRISGPSMSRPSTPKLNEPSSPVNIPKIAAPPASPKHSRPSTPKTLETCFPEIPKFPGLASPKVSRPSTPKHLEPVLAEAIIIPRIPGPPPSPKHSRPSTPKLETLISISTDPPGPEPPRSPNPDADSAEASGSASVSTGAFPRPRGTLHRCATLPSRGEMADHARTVEALVVPSLGLGPRRSPSPNPGPSSMPSPGPGPSPKAKSAAAGSKVTAPLLEASESGSFDSEENRDTVAEGALTRPTLFDLRPRPKLKHQWSMDETRAAAAARDLAAAGATMKPAEKRRRFFMRKQTNSAPDSFDGVTGHIPPAKHKEHHSVSFCLGSVRKCRGSDSSIQPPVLPTISE